MSAQYLNVHVTVLILGKSQEMHFEFKCNIVNCVMR